MDVCQQPCTLLFTRLQLTRVELAAYEIVVKIKFNLLLQSVLVEIFRTFWEACPNVWCP